MIMGNPRRLIPTTPWSLTLFLILGCFAWAARPRRGRWCFAHGPRRHGHAFRSAGDVRAWFLKPMYLNYHGSVSAQIPTAAGLAGDVDATVNTVALAGGRTFETTILGGAHYTFAVALPYSWCDITANVQTPAGSVRRHNEVSGLGDLTMLPMMLAWKTGDWQFDAILPIYAPTGNYEKGRLGNTGLNYWTFDPMVGVVYSHKASGFNAMLHGGYAMNTENPDTDYQSGSMLHLEGVIQQFIPVGSGFLNLGVEGFYFDQVTGDSGAGAKLGDFKGRTVGVDRCWATCSRLATNRWSWN